jgi:dUTP pyrophosphatase
MDALGIQTQPTQPTSTKPQVELKLLNGQHLVPSYATPGSAAVDLTAHLSEPITLHPGDTYLMPTGISIHLSNPNLVAMMLPRSGLAFNDGLVIGNLTGVIDSDYQGQLFAGLWNRGNKVITVNPGQRVVQMVIIKCEQVEFQVVEEFGMGSQRGEGGFGHTGV